MEAADEAGLSEESKAMAEDARASLEAERNAVEKTGEAAREQNEEAKAAAEEAVEQKREKDATLAQNMAGDARFASNPEGKVAFEQASQPLRDIVDNDAAPEPQTPEDFRRLAGDAEAKFNEGGSETTKRQKAALTEKAKKFVGEWTDAIKEKDPNFDASEAIRELVEKTMEERMPKETEEAKKEERSKRKSKLVKLLLGFLALGALAGLAVLAAYLIAKGESGCYEVITDTNAGTVQYTKPVQAIFDLEDPSTQSDPKKQCICATAGTPPPAGKGGIPCNPKEIGGDTGGKPMLTYVYQEYTAGDMLGAAMGGIGDLLGNIFQAVSGAIGFLPTLLRIGLYIAIGAVGFVLLRVLLSAVSNRSKVQQQQQQQLLGAPSYEGMGAVSPNRFPAPTGVGPGALPAASAAALPSTGTGTGTAAATLPAPTQVAPAGGRAWLVPRSRGVRR